MDMDSLFWAGSGGLSTFLLRIFMLDCALVVIE